MAPADRSARLRLHNRTVIRVMFSRRQTLRRWAAMTLLLWLFGVGAGVAHACLAPNLVAPGDESGALATPAEAASGHTACHDAGPTHDHEGLQGKTNCQDFCDKASVSIPPLKTALDDVLGAALLFPVVAGIAPVPALAPVQHAVPRRDGALAPPVPIVIAFLRLTL
jgi:hypothetical protein